MNTYEQRYKSRAHAYAKSVNILKWGERKEKEKKEKNLSNLKNDIKMGKFSQKTNKEPLLSNFAILMSTTN